MYPIIMVIEAIRPLFKGKRIQVIEKQTRFEATDSLTLNDAAPQYLTVEICEAVEEVELDITDTE